MSEYNLEEEHLLEADTERTQEIFFDGSRLVSYYSMKRNLYENIEDSAKFRAAKCKLINELQQN